MGFFENVGTLPKYTISEFEKIAPVYGGIYAIYDNVIPSAQGPVIIRAVEWDGDEPWKCDICALWKLRFHVPGGGGWKCPICGDLYFELM